jgi:hypothetical protein
MEVPRALPVGLHCAFFNASFPLSRSIFRGQGLAMGVCSAFTPGPPVLFPWGSNQQMNTVEYDKPR